MMKRNILQNAQYTDRASTIDKCWRNEPYGNFRFGHIRSERPESAAVLLASVANELTAQLPFVVSTTISLCTTSGG
jgi:hypothetical protein